MKTMSTMAGGAVFALLLGSGAVFAQGVLIGNDVFDDRLDDRLDDIEENVQDDFARSEDESRFGNPEFRPGLSGSASLSYVGNTGTSEGQEFTAGARLRFAQGQLVQTIGVALDFAESEGIKTSEDVFGVYDANYYFDDRFYGFVLGRIESNGLATLGTEVKTDAFVGVGPGYRIINTPDIAWRVQAGIGVRYIEDGLDESETETAYIVSSRFFYSFNENVFATNDTDILKSDSALSINNDLGVNFKMSDAFSTRVSYLTEYNDSRLIRTDNKLGVSLVYGF